MHAKYTVVLKDLMDNEQTSEKLSAALSTYPLYQQQNPDIPKVIPDRSELNKRLLNNYKYREIGFETVGRFLDELEITMCEIMPYYNDLYKTVEIMAGIEDPFGNVDVTETYQEKSSGSASSEGTVSQSTESANTTESSDSSTTETNVHNNSKNVHSATPQGQLDIATEDINSIEYADDVAWSQSKNNDNATTTETSEGSSTTSQSQESESSSSSSTSGSIEHTLTRKGNQGVNTYAHDMIEFRTSIIDVTNKIINDSRIRELFMLVY